MNTKMLEDIKKKAERKQIQVGDRFGALTTVVCLGYIAPKGVIWECKCDCGKTTRVRAYNLVKKTKGCGCSRTRLAHLTEEELKRKTTEPRVCIRCNECKTVDQFGFLNSKICADCGRANQRKLHRKYSSLPKYRHRKNRRAQLRQYGITQDQFDELVKSQNGLCAICKDKEKSSRSQYLQIDHCHSTLKVRGLLCRECNLVLGNANDNLEILRNAISYLEATSL